MILIYNIGSRTFRLRNRCLQRKEYHFYLLEAATGVKGYSPIPSTLFERITFLARVLPVRSVPTFIELLIGAMLAQAGFVTEAWLAINPLRSWTAYYKWLQQGKWSWVALGVQLARLMVTRFPQSAWFLIFDDTIIYRSSKKAPGSTIHHPHGNKTNRPQYAPGASAA